ncbi:MAG TPA: glutathionylspermidine synthase family protein [Candidatus Binatia bacterium]|jgi:glutathionylspermidine synthase|nr:glutathionylspermidine synthase family protein [Candidatus Binatia bacterium]
MQRHCCKLRSGWREKVEAVGLTYHSHEEGPYWDESACYELTALEVDVLEAATNKLHYLCIDAAEAIIENNWWPRLGIPPVAVPSIRRSWERDDFSLYGRFDLSYDGETPPKLLEYNADTPTALVEAAVAQWFWLQDTHPGADQFNSIHERLIEAWRRWKGTTIHFSSIKEHAEDEMTVLYLRDTCEQAGVKTKPVYVEDIGWDSRRKRFVDLDNQIIERCFKLYPWEWLWHEDFGVHLAEDPARFIEPTWKMLLSNKGLLPILWELFPEHPNLLPAYELADPLGGSYVRKPRLSREGSNVTWVEGGVVVEETPGDYGAEGHVYQAPATLGEFDGHHPIFGVWVVDHEAAGLGIREDTRRITGNLSRFVPHFFR